MNEIFWTAVDAALQSWAQDQEGDPATGAPMVIWREQNAPLPVNDDGETFVTTLRKDSLVKLGLDYFDTVDDSGLQLITGNREFTLEVFCYGPGAMTRAESLRDSLSQTTVLDGLREAGISIFGEETIQNLTDLHESRYEERALLDLHCRVAVDITDNVGVIEEVKAVATYADAGGTPRVVQDLDIKIVGE